MQHSGSRALGTPTSIGARWAALQDDEVGLFSAFGLGALLLGGLTAWPIRAIGRLYIGEVLLIVMAIYGVVRLLSAAPQYRRHAFLLSGLMMTTLLGYMLSDFYRGAPVEDYLRGWSRIGVMITSFLALAWLSSTSRNYFLFFCLGWAIVNAAFPLTIGFVSIRHYWKFFASFPCMYATVFLLRRWNPYLIIAALGGITLLTACLDNRSVALVCMATGAVVFVSSRMTRKGVFRKKLKPLTIMAIAVTMLGFLVVGFQAVKTYGEYFGFSHRQQKSNIGRLTSFQVTWQAIKRSPLIGYGSFPKDQEFAMMRDKLIEKKTEEHAFRGEQRRDRIIAHSQLIQGWLEGGILGGIFFFAFAFLLVKYGLFLMGERPYDWYTGVAAIILINSAWHLLFSPFNGSQRTQIAFACVVICRLAHEKFVLAQARNEQTAAPVVIHYLPREATAS